MERNSFKVILFLISILFVSQPNIAQEIGVDTIPSNSLDNQFEKLNIEWLELNYTTTTPSGKIIDYSYEVKLPHYYILLEGNKISGYYFFYITNDSYYILQKSYYPNGNIKEKGKLFNNTGNNKVGKWYSYNESGDLIKVEDFDKDFDFTFDDAIQYCIDHNIPVDRGAEPYIYPSHKTNIDRRCLPTLDSCVYTIIHFTGSITYKTINLDGKTGEELSIVDGEIVGS